MIYGYARVSTFGQAKDGNSLEVQKKALEDAGAEMIYYDSCTGRKLERPELNKLVSILKPGDILVVTKMSRLARSMNEGSKLISNLLEQGITLNVLNIGLMDNSPSGKLIRNIFLAFAEFECDMIVERTQEGKAIAKQNPNFKEGRPKKYSTEKINHALELLENYSYNQVEAMTGISKSTLQRERRRRRNMESG